MKKNGSALLMTLLITLSLATLAHVVFKSCSYGIDLTHERATYEQSLYIADGLLRYGVCLVQENFQKIAQSNQTITLSFESVGIVHDKKVQGVLIITPGEKLVIRAHAKQGDQTLCALECAVQSNDQKPNFTVSDWLCHARKKS